MYESAIETFERTIDSIITGIEGLNPPDIIDFIENELSLPAGESESGRIKLEPYQIEPIRAHMKGGTEILISMIEQSGKSTIWKLVCIYKARYFPAPAMIIYENHSKAKEINEESFEPLLCSLPYFADLKEKRPELFQKSKYKFNGGWIDIQGAGADITSKAKRFMYDDEIDTQPLTYDKQKTQCMNVRKRTRSYARLGLHNITWCGSFKRSFETSTLWWLAADSDLGFWHLRCDGCGELTINSTAHEVKYIDNGKDQRWVCLDQKVLKYKTIRNRFVDEESCRLVCPECNHEHESADLAGDYISMYPDIDDKRTFIVGGLGSRVNDLVKLCKSHLKMRQTSNVELKRNIMNSDFGLPIDLGVSNAEAKEKLESHCIERVRDAHEIDYCLMTCDTQTSPFGWYWVVRGYNDFGSYYITSGFCCELLEDRTVDKEATKEALRKLFTKKYCGHEPLFIGIDQGGTHAKAVKEMAREFKNVYQYKGEGGRVHEVVRFSKDKKQIRLILCQEKQINEDLRYYIYKDDNSTWYLPNDGLNPEYERHILNVDVNTGLQIQDDYTCRKDYFDCEKMQLALVYMLEKRIEKELIKRGKVVEIVEKEEKPVSFVNKVRPRSSKSFVNNW